MNDELIKITNEEMDLMESIPSKYESLITIVKNDDESYIEYHVTSNTLRKILNKDSEVQIGDSIYVFTYYTTYIFSTENYVSRDQMDIKEARKISVKRKLLSQEGLRADIAQCDNNWSSKRKMSGEIEVTDAGYFEIGTRVKNRKKNFIGLWIYTDAQSLFLSGTGLFSVRDELGITMTVGGACFDSGANEAEKQFIFFSGWGDFDLMTGHTWNILYSVTPKDFSNQTKTCTLVQ